MQAYVLGLEGCDLSALSAVVHDLCAGIPEPREFAPNSGQLAKMVRDEQARRRWEAEGEAETKALPHITISPEEAQRRMERVAEFRAKLDKLTTPSPEEWIAQQKEAGTITDGAK